MRGVGERAQRGPSSLAQILRQLVVLVVVITVIVSVMAYSLGVQGHLAIVFISAAVVVVLSVALGRDRRGQPRVAARVAIAGTFVLCLSLMLLAPIASALAFTAASMSSLVRRPQILIRVRPVPGSFQRSELM